jgi:hypothetical protein
MNSKYYELIIKPEFLNSGLYDNINKIYLDSNQSIVSTDLFLQVVNLNNRYLRYARMSVFEKKLFYYELFLLDKEGCELRDLISTCHNLNVKYFSEGLLNYIKDYPKLNNYPRKPNTVIYKTIKKIIYYFSSNTYGRYE